MKFVYRVPWSLHLLMINCIFEPGGIITGPPQSFLNLQCGSTPLNKNLNRPPLSTLLATVYVQIIPIHQPRCTWLLLSTSEAEKILMKLDLTRPQELNKKHNHHSRVSPIWSDMLLYAPFEAGRLADYSWYLRKKVLTQPNPPISRGNSSQSSSQVCLFASKIHGVMRMDSFPMNHMMMGSKSDDARAHRCGPGGPNPKDLGYEQGPRSAEMTCMGYSEEFAYSNATLPPARKGAPPITRQSLYLMRWKTRESRGLADAKASHATWMFLSWQLWFTHRFTIWTLKAGMPLLSPLFPCVMLMSALEHSGVEALSFLLMYVVCGVLQVLDIT